jgi:DNA-binding PadR family transcriptional regulator
MELDTDRIDAAVLALLLLGLHDGCRVWKTFDWDTMNRLHEKGFISDPVGKAKSVLLTEEGEREAQRLFQAMFAARS